MNHQEDSIFYPNSDVREPTPTRRPGYSRILVDNNPGPNPWAKLLQFVPQLEMLFTADGDYLSKHDITPSMQTSITIAAAKGEIPFEDVEQLYVWIIEHFPT